MAHSRACASHRHAVRDTRASTEQASHSGIFFDTLYLLRTTPPRIIAPPATRKSVIPLFSRSCGLVGAILTLKESPSSAARS